MLKEQYKETQDKLSKAKAVRTNFVLGLISFADCVPSSSNLKISCLKRNRQKRVEEELARYVKARIPRMRSLMCTPQGVHEEAEARIKVLEEEVQRLKVCFWIQCKPDHLDEGLFFFQRLLVEQRARFEKEVHLLLGFIHSFGMNTMRDLATAGAQQQSRSNPNSWLAQQRSNVCCALRCTQPSSLIPCDSLGLISGDDPSPARFHPYIYPSGIYHTLLFSLVLTPIAVAGGGVCSLFGRRLLNDLEFLWITCARVSTNKASM